MEVRRLLCRRRAAEAAPAIDAAPSGSQFKVLFFSWHSHKSCNKRITYKFMHIQIIEIARTSHCIYAPELHILYVLSSSAEHQVIKRAKALQAKSAAALLLLYQR
jgi:predicted xylose isomerase-like sugar epimerase